MTDTNIQITMFRVPSAFKIDSDILFGDQNQFVMKIFTLHNGLHNKIGFYIFPIFIGIQLSIYRISIVPNLKCTHAVFAKL